jgi:CheY-like chemotaxis protein/HPt (histidine-containing phosphotransfer) domain-containing protein
VNLSLDLFRMEQGNYPFVPQPVDLLDVLRTVLADVRPHAQTKGVQLRLRVDGAEPAPGAAVHAWAEELLCYSILANLVKNAVEAVPEQGVIGIELRTGDPLALCIHNAGAVPESIRECFFDKYATAGKSDGTGLGTYSARLMARVQGGELAMRTSEAEGTTLTLTLPAATAEQAQAQQERAGAVADAPVRAAELPASVVLLVDDDEFNLLVMRRYLPTPPLQVHSAVNGRAAVEAALQSRPDLVLIDLDMPVMDGLEATRRLRELQRDGRLKPCTIVMLSSHDDPGTRDRALQAGCDLYLCKPVSKETLLRTVQWAATEGRPEFRPAPAPMPAEDEIDADLIDRLPAFLASRRELVQAMHAASAAGDAEAVRRHAHRLAGSFALYGLRAAAEQARRIELGRLPHAELLAAAAELLSHLDAVQSRTLAAAVDGGVRD